VFLISGATGEGTRPLVESVMQLLEALAQGREPEVKGNFQPAPLPVKAKAKTKAKAKKKAKKTAGRRKIAARK
jgi:predicted ATPase